MISIKLWKIVYFGHIYKPVKYIFLKRILQFEKIFVKSECIILVGGNFQRKSRIKCRFYKHLPEFFLTVAKYNFVNLLFHLINWKKVLVALVKGFQNCNPLILTFRSQAVRIYPSLFSQNCRCWITARTSRVFPFVRLYTKAASVDLARRIFCFTRWWLLVFTGLGARH